MEIRSFHLNGNFVPHPPDYALAQSLLDLKNSFIYLSYHVLFCRKNRRKYYLRNYMKKTLFRVRFQGKEEKNLMEVVVENIYNSDFIGLITLENFIFMDQTKQVILSSEDQARKKFSKTKKLHIPYHCVLTIEEYTPDPIKMDNLPFIRKTHREEKNKESRENS